MVEDSINHSARSSQTHRNYLEYIQYHCRAFVKYLPGEQFVLHKCAKHIESGAQSFENVYVNI